MWDIRSGDFERCGISENNFVYKICEDAYIALQKGQALVNDEASHHALRSMTGIGLVLTTIKTREGRVEYNNPNELMELLEAARTLKGVYPELFNRYGFGENLQVLANLQLDKQSSLKARIQSEMEHIYQKNVDDKEPLY